MLIFLKKYYNWQKFLCGLFMYVYIILSLLLVFFVFLFFSKKNNFKKKVNTINSLIDTGYVEEAESILDKIAISKNKKCIIKWLHARINMELGHYSLVLHAANELLIDKNCSSDVSEKDIRKLLAEVYLKTSHIDSAETEYKTILFLDKNDLDVNFRLGKLYFDKEQYVKAEYYLLNSLDYANVDYLSLYMLASIYEKSNKLDKTKKYIFASVKTNKNYLPSLFLKAKVLYYDRNYKEARKIFRIFEYDSEYYIEAQTYMALLYYDERNKNKFIEIAEHIVNEIKDYSLYNNIVDKLINTYFDLKRLDDALFVMYNIQNVAMLKPAIANKLKCYKYIHKYEGLKNIVLLSDDDFVVQVKEMIEMNGYIIDKIDTFKTELYFSVIKENARSLVAINRLEIELSVDTLKTIVNFAKIKGEYYVNVFTPFVFDEDIAYFYSERPTLILYDGNDMGAILENEKKF